MYLRLQAVVKMRMRNSEFQTLDIEQLETDTTDIEDRAEYCEKNVEYTSSKATIMNDENTK